MIDFVDNLSSPWFSDTLAWTSLIERRTWVIGGLATTLEVQSATEHGGRLWLQVASRTEPTASMLLQIFPGAQPGSLTRALMSLPWSCAWPHRVDVFAEQPPDRRSPSPVLPAYFVH